MARNTRLATTIVARYTPNVGAVDAFYLDGRTNSAREEQYADITLDREDRGAFLALYASSHGSNEPQRRDDGNRVILDRITEDLKKNSRHNIDYEINDLAEAAVNVAGRLTIADGAIRQPYFSGIIVKDGEMAAITLGRGTAYLYRDDALYPLTQDDFQLEPVDHFGNRVQNMDDFAAGVAGTIRYSNIAQLKPDDCIIMCNREIMEAIGQKQMLEILDNAQDQQEAASMVLDVAADVYPNVSLQFMIAFVEDVVTIDRLGRSTLARGFSTGTGRTSGRTSARQERKEPFRDDYQPSPAHDAAAGAAGTAGAAAWNAADGDRLPPYDHDAEYKRPSMDGMDDYSVPEDTHVYSPLVDGDLGGYDNEPYTSASQDDGGIQFGGFWNEDEPQRPAVDYSAEPGDDEPQSRLAAAWSGLRDSDDPDRIKKIVVVVLAVIALILIIFIIVSLANDRRRRNGEETTDSTPSSSESSQDDESSSTTSEDGGVIVSPPSESSSDESTEDPGYVFPSASNEPSQSSSTDTTVTPPSSPTAEPTQPTDAPTSASTAQPGLNYTGPTESYVIQAGDSVYGIAGAQNSGTMTQQEFIDAMVELNNWPNVFILLTPGESIIIPSN